MYDTVNNGVYRAGFASTQTAYADAAHQVFETLDRLDAHLADRPYLCGDQLTEADIRLFPTLARFDVAYHYAFRCNLRRLSDYAHLWPYAKRLYHLPGVAETVRFDIYKQGYFSASEKRNPLGIAPIGPVVDWG
ncbi:MAG: glutathione S-transferase family protein [Pseudomonadota bacterium]